ncbi:DUF1360 domain-containing protein [Mesobacillus zeae]|uniref:DUF1360 domain-containing protein n=1 Tax=Mesobacillus zeae TaxID=1917180 RepID=A0A398AWJ3_9BACI|nr:DUF1360 domain-containing protein [Mesobacillus zeae]RID82037.1 DUF1360 domain-containing protein [Mesobacillus zeae]
MSLGNDVWSFVILGLASFRLTRLLVYDKITEFLRSPFIGESVERDEDGHENIYLVPKGKGLQKWLGELLSCHWCTGIWVSAFLYVIFFMYPDVGWPAIMILSVAAIGSIIEVIVTKLIGE